MKLSILAIISAVASAVSAYTPPVGEPSGNPIGHPGLNEQVPAGKPFTITWSPTTQGTVSLVLLRGPSENVKPIATIVEGIANSGTYSWTPSTALEADTARYGIQIIVDGTGQYQYSTQFGIANDAPVSTITPTTSTTASTTKTTTDSTTKTTTDSTTTTEPTTISTSTTATANVTTISSTTKIPTTTKLTTDEGAEEETGVPKPENTTTTIKPTQSPIQEDSAAGKIAGSFGLVAFVAGVIAIAM